MAKTKLCFKVVALVLTLFMVIPGQAISAATTAAKVVIDHQSPGDRYIPGFRIQLDVTIKNDQGLLATRCYFKAKNDKAFTFVNMRNIKSGEYRAILPSPWLNSEFIEYLFL